MKKIFLLMLSMIVVFLGVNSVSAGNSHECGFTINGDLKCWGSTQGGLSNTPQGYEWKKVITGSLNTCGITTNNELKCWGYNFYGQNIIPSNYLWKDFDLGLYHTCGITIDDELKCWGYNLHGQLNIPIGYKWKKIILGNMNTCGITTDDELKCWGYNYDGQNNIPIDISWKEIDFGGYHICGITTDDELKCWGGLNNYGELDIPEGYLWKKINLGGYHTCGMTTDDELKCWGYNFYGQNNIPIDISWKEIDLGGNHTCGITTDDELKCWGYNYYKQLNFPVGYKWKSFTENIEIQEPTQIPTPTNLKQYIKSPLLEREEIQAGTTIGKFQSGSGVILEASIQNDTTNSYNMIFEVYKHGQTIPMYTDSIEIFSGTGTITIPYLGEGNYTWKVKATDNNGNTSEVVDYATNQAWEIDFSLFEGFEPYPYGFSFTNKPTYSKNLDGGIDNTGLFHGKREKIDGYKWDVFESAFDLSELDSERKLFNTFEMLGLNQENPSLFDGACFGLSTSALMYKSYPQYLSKNYTQFYNGVNNDIFGVTDFDTLIENGITYWNDTDNLIFKDIQAIQTSQGSEIFQKEEKKSMDKESIDILNEIKNMNNGYILGFQGLNEYGFFSKHYVIPYKIEGNKIYIWDSNIFINNNGAHYKQYLEILPNGKIYSPHYNDELKWKTIDEIYIVPIEVMYNNGGKHKPIGLEYGDYYDIIFGGSSDIYLSDENGNISGIKDGNIYKEIDGVSFTRNGSYIANSDSNDGLINFSVSNDLTGLNINVDGKIDEIYDLYVSTNDFFTKIENIPTKVGDRDSFNITRENISMKLSDKNNSKYTILSDDFKDNGTGTIYISNSVIEQGLTNYDINWEEVIKNGESSITKSVDNDLDGEYEKIQEIKPITNNDGKKGEISGIVYNDKNKNGLFDKNDNLLKGYKVALYIEDGDDFLYNKKDKKKNNPKHKYKCYSGLKNPEKHSEKDKNNEHEDINCFVKTNKEGFFSFKNLEDGKYIIELLNNKDKNNKDGFGEVYEITILNGSVSTNNNFIITKNEKTK
ncbi:MAG: hypothetical protein PHI37_05370 [Candidatus Gracilibacteria bacterium]|nr:hypothetical protein [Candidatus Gracilibacteria bacterium]